MYLRLIYRKIRVEVFKRLLDKRILSLSNKLIDRMVYSFESSFNRSPKTMIEVGANFFQDSEYAKRFFGIYPIAIEANPEIYSLGKKLYPNIESHCIAISISEGEQIMFSSGLNSDNNGVSSFYKRKTEADWITNTITVKTTTLSKFFSESPLKFFDLIKIDVEGHTYEVLLGAQEILPRFGLIQAECEDADSVWENQKGTFEEINNLLLKNDFTLIYFERSSPDSTQCDAIWINMKYS